MAKFLPFVVEKSTPLHIYQALISRSKGMNNILVASIFYLVLDEGILSVRKAAKEIPDIALDKLYEELLARFPRYRISDKFYHKMQAVGRFLVNDENDHIPKELKEYETQDIMSFLLVVTLAERLGEYTKLLLGRLLDETLTDHVEQDLPQYRLFYSEGQSKIFNSKEDLTGYAHLYGCVLDIPTVPVKAVLKVGHEGERNATS